MCCSQSQFLRGYTSSKGLVTNGLLSVHDGDLNLPPALQHHSTCLVCAQVRLIHINNTGPDLLPLQTSRVSRDRVYQRLTATEKLAIWERGECSESLKRPLQTNATETFHHYCEEFWFKTSIDVKLNMSAILPIMDGVINDYLPLQHSVVIGAEGSNQQITQ